MATKKKASVSKGAGKSAAKAPRSGKAKAPAGKARAVKAPAKAVKAPAKAAKAPAKAPEPRKVARLAFKLDSRVCLRKEVAWRMIEGEAVIVTPADSMMHSLNEVGTRIWQLLDGKRTIRDVATTLAAEFEVDGTRVESDTLWFVECLAKKGLVETA